MNATMASVQFPDEMSAYMVYPDLSLGPAAHVYHWARVKPTEIAVVAPGRILTWDGLLKEVQSVAIELRGLSITDPVLTNYQFESELIIELACLHEGIVVGSLPNASYNELSSLAAIFPHLISSEHNDEFSAFHQHVLAEYRVAKSVDWSMTPHRHTEDEIVKVVFSSGTTGSPKPIAFSSRALAARTKSVAETYLSISPFFTFLSHKSAPGNASLLTNLWRGTTHFVRSSVPNDQKLVREYGIRNIVTSPAMLRDHLDYAEANFGMSLEHIHTLGSPLPDQLAKATAERLGVEITNIYGSTEAGVMASRLWHQGDYSLAGAIDKDAQVEIVDEDLGILDAGKVGIIRVRTSNQSSGIFGPDGRGDAFAPDGWFYPGDRGFIDKSGLLYVIGRIDDLINKGGIKIDPIPVERFAVERFNLKESAYIFGEQEDGTPHFALIVVATSRVNTNDILLELKKEYGHSAPDLVLQSEFLPRNENGKIIRRAAVKTEDN